MTVNFDVLFIGRIYLIILVHIEILISIDVSKATKPIRHQRIPIPIFRFILGTLLGSNSALLTSTIVDIV
jgi:hypothetical protein